jgi:hypothetical protein
MKENTKKYTRRNTKQYNLPYINQRKIYNLKHYISIMFIKNVLVLSQYY